MSPEPYDQVTQLRFSSGKTKDVRARNTMTLKDDFRVAIVLQPDNRPFHLLATTATGMAKTLKNPERIRDAVAEANRQLKNAIKYKIAPCLLMIFHGGIDVPEEEVITSALYGDLKYTFPRDKFDEGKLLLDGNGAWNVNKNRTTSALMYVRNKAEPIIVHNYWAHRPFPPGIFLCKEIAALANGTFRETDYSLAPSSPNGKASTTSTT